MKTQILHWTEIDLIYFDAGQSKISDSQPLIDPTLRDFDLRFCKLPKAIFWLKGQPQIQELLIAELIWHSAFGRMRAGKDVQARILLYWRV